MNKTSILLVILCCFAGQGHAQFLKKLGKKAERAAEKAVERRVEKKATEKTEQALDSTVDRKRTRKRKSDLPSLSNATPAESYAFDYRAEMQITSGKDVMNINYFIPKTGNYLCAMIQDKRIKEDFLSVFDIDREAMFTFMKNKGQKIKMSVDLKTYSAAEEAMEEATISIRETGKNKTILGYNCQEYEITGEDMSAIIWVTKAVAIRFPSTFHSIQQKDGYTQSWMKNIDGWAMEMTMVDTSQKKPQTIKMNCLSINESKLKINSSDYQSMSY